MTQYFQHLWQPRGHANQKIWQLAWPMILANITVPLLGFVDTAVIGHLNSSDYLSGTALGGLVITITFWLLGFLRMSTTALAAQANGRKDDVGLQRVMLQGLVLSFALASLIIIAQSGLFQFMLLLVDNSSDMDRSLFYAQQYFEIRIWIAPISLANLVLTGFLIGVGRTRPVLVAVVSCNLINVIADLIFVPVMGLGVSGVAYASIIAECSQFIILAYVNRAWLKKLKPLRQASYQGVLNLVTMNKVLFMRSALLQFCISFMTIYASRFGPNAVAVNAILMQFFLFLSFALDGVAFALEAMVGKAYGAQQTRQVRLLIYRGFWFGFKCALLYTLVYVLFASEIFRLLTDIPALHHTLDGYYLIVIALPLGSFMCFIFDGLFIGLGWVKGMRNSMLFATVVFVLGVALNQYLGGQNVGLWIAFWLFLLSRGGSQYWMVRKNGAFV